MTSTPFSPRPLSGPSSNWSPAGACPAADASSPAPLLRRPRRPRTRVSLPPLLQPRRLVPRRPRHGPGASPRRPLRPHRADPAGPRRHAVSQTRPDSFRRGDAPRPLDVQQGLESLPRGARLGRPLPAPARPRLFENGKQRLGLQDPAHRLPRAVERTARLALVLYPRIVVWFDHEGHRCVRFPERPWRRHKHEPLVCGHADEPPSPDRAGELNPPPPARRCRAKAAGAVAGNGLPRRRKQPRLAASSENIFVCPLIYPPLQWRDGPAATSEICETRS